MYKSEAYLLERKRLLKIKRELTAQLKKITDKQNLIIGNILVDHAEKDNVFAFKIIEILEKNAKEKDKKHISALIKTLRDNIIKNLQEQNEALEKP